MSRAHASVGASQGSTNQRWHLDYNETTSSIFITCTGASANSTTQYLVPQGEAFARSFAKRAADNPDEVLCDELVPQSADGVVSIRSVLAKPFTTLVMKPGSIHRGQVSRWLAQQATKRLSHPVRSAAQANPITGKLRVTFWISMTTTATVEEPEFIDFKKN